MNAFYYNTIMKLLMRAHRDSALGDYREALEAVKTAEVELAMWRKWLTEDIEDLSSSERDALIPPHERESTKDG